MSVASGEAGRITAAESPPCREPAASPVRVLLAGEATGGRLAVVEVRERRDTAHPRHIHAGEDETVYVLEGVVVFDTGDGPVAVPAGTCVHLPRGGEHSLRVETEEARLLLIITPAGLEDYYRALHDRPRDPEGWTEVERLVTLAARFEVTITGPGC